MNSATTIQAVTTGPTMRNRIGFRTKQATTDHLYQAGACPRKLRKKAWSMGREGERGDSGFGIREWEVGSREWGNREVGDQYFEDAI
jgi:hypothetical protein